jgi:phosphonate dehydrogenase
LESPVADRDWTPGARAIRLDAVSPVQPARRCGSRPLVLVSHPLRAAARDLLNSACDVRVLAGWTGRATVETEHTAGALVFMRDAIDRALLERMPRLLIVAGALKGTDNVDLQECTRRGIWVSACADMLTVPTAELAFGLLLGLARRIREADEFVRGDSFTGWQPGMYGRMLCASTLGIIGMGSVGQAVASRAYAFGMRVLYCDPDAPACSIAGAERVELEDLLVESDVLMPLLPLTSTSRGLIDQQTIAKMRSGALIVNVARGSIVREDAIAQALNDGRLGGYAADVFALEDASIEDRPRRVHRGLLEHPRTLFTPHLGSAIASVREQIEIDAATNILAALAGDTPPGAVNSPPHPRARRPSGGAGGEQTAA